MDEGILIEFNDFDDFQSVAKEYGIAFQYCYTDEGIVAMGGVGVAADILWAINVLDDIRFMGEA